MHPHLKYLIELQAVDLRLIEIRERMSRFPKRLAELEGRVTAVRQQITTAKDALTGSLKDRKTYEMDVEQWKERAKKYRNQSGEVKTNEAYKALQHEIQNAEDEVAKAEDRRGPRLSRQCPKIWSTTMSASRSGMVVSPWPKSAARVAASAASTSVRT